MADLKKYEVMLARGASQALLAAQPLVAAMRLLASDWPSTLMLRSGGKARKHRTRRPKASGLVSRPGAAARATRGTFFRRRQVPGRLRLSGFHGQERGLKSEATCWH